MWKEKKDTLNAYFSLSDFLIIKYLSNHSLDYLLIKEGINMENVL